MTNSLRDLFLFPSSLCSCLLTCADYRVLREASYKRRSPRDWWSSGAGGFSSWGFAATSSKAWWRNAGSWRNANQEANGGKLVLFFLLSAACVLILKTIVLMPPISSPSPPLILDSDFSSMIDWYSTFIFSKLWWEHHQCFFWLLSFLYQHGPNGPRIWHRWMLENLSSSKAYFTVHSFNESWHAEAPASLCLKLNQPSAWSCHGPHQFS